METVANQNYTMLKPLHEKVDTLGVEGEAVRARVAAGEEFTLSFSAVV